MDQSIRKLLSQYGAVASSADALERARQALGPVSMSEMAEVLRLQEVARNQRHYENLYSTVASSAIGSIGDINQYTSAFNAVSDQIEKNFLKTSVVDQIPESVRAAIEGRTAANVAEQWQRDQVAALTDMSIRYGAVSASSLALLASEQSPWQTDLSRVASEFRMSQLGMAAAVDSIRSQKTITDAFRLTQADEVASLVKKVIDADRLAAFAFADSFAVESLTSRMSAMEMPWLNISDTVRSVAAFAHVQAIGDIVHGAPPFASEVAGWLRADLGDWRDAVTMRPDDLIDPGLRTQLYVDRGINRTLTEFTPQAFHQSVSIARLTDVEWVEVEDWCPENSDELLRNKTAFHRLQLFEMAIRRFIVAAMTAAFGDDWMARQLPNGMLDSWKQKQQSDVKAGAYARPLIDYADFTDYLPIIERRDNWSRVFKSIFGRPEDIRESLQRLYPVRLATMHARVITQDDTLLLMVETKRVVKSFGKL
jgi:hypothetical protein